MPIEAEIIPVENDPTTKLRINLKRKYQMRAEPPSKKNDTSTPEKLAVRKSQKSFEDKL